MVFHACDMQDQLPSQWSPWSCQGEYYIPTQGLDLATYPGFLNSGASVIQGRPVRGLQQHCRREVLATLGGMCTHAQLP